VAVRPTRFVVKRVGESRSTQNKRGKVGRDYLTFDEARRGDTETVRDKYSERKVT